MAAAEGAACGESRPTPSGQGGPTAPCYWPDASGRSSTGSGGGGVFGRVTTLGGECIEFKQFDGGGGDCDELDEGSGW